ncbi:DUF2789 domain-containing protein [Shewanella aestuarii]|uniref:DUF2789 domain-containing protein n=1 Tax=Shewanella aestuarii TaxID=1028752 RepID=A0A6G9QKH4_9GAMM|nr:DUF2789 domain-containing protein [Shewanella aestuarii]QIR14962.1 DUF2789 domain-containing protein [Shewanella aestuarii]
MDTTKTNLNHLFQQLGLSNRPEDITIFIAAHALDKHTLLIDAPFWNSAQRTFLTESLQEDAQWSEVIDQLDVMLRQSSNSE